MSYVVTLPHDHEWRPLEWAKRHCPSYITNAAHRRDANGERRSYDYDIDYFFADERDAVWFQLRWS